MLTRLLLLTLLLLPVSGCVTEIPAQDEPPENPLCIGTRAARTNLAAALAETPDDRVLLAGAKLIDVIDAGCAK
jgi:hypothetical protein